MTYRDPAAMERAFEFVMEYGKMLHDKEEWDMEDNFDATEMLYDTYQKIMGLR